jgi:hypothetical protein
MPAVGGRGSARQRPLQRPAAAQAPAGPLPSRTRRCAGSQVRGRAAGLPPPPPPPPTKGHGLQLDARHHAHAAGHRPQQLVDVHLGGGGWGVREARVGELRGCGCLGVGGPSPGATHPPQEAAAAAAAAALPPDPCHPTNHPTTISPTPPLRASCSMENPARAVSADSMVPASLAGLVVDSYSASSSPSSSSRTLAGDAKQALGGQGCRGRHARWRRPPPPQRPPSLVAQEARPFKRGSAARPHPDGPRMPPSPARLGSVTRGSLLTSCRVPYSIAMPHAMYCLRGEGGVSGGRGGSGGGGAPRLGSAQREGKKGSRLAELALLKSAPAQTLRSGDDRPVVGPPLPYPKPLSMPPVPSTPPHPPRRAAPEQHGVVPPRRDGAHHVDQPAADAAPRVARGPPSVVGAVEAERQQQRQHERRVP